MSLTVQQFLLEKTLLKQVDEKFSKFMIIHERLRKDESVYNIQFHEYHYQKHASSMPPDSQNFSVEQMYT